MTVSFTFSGATHASRHEGGADDVSGDFVQKGGDTMTGALVLPGSPTTSLQAATKGYVDTQVAGVGGSGVATFNTRTGAVTLTKADVTGTGLAASDVAAVPAAGGTMTGLLTLSGAPTSNLHAATKLYVDSANLEHLLYPATNVVVETCRRMGDATGSTVSTTSGQLRAVLRPLAAGTPIHSITYVSGAIALASGTHQWFALLDSTGKVLAVTSDDTSTAWAANSPKTLAIAGGTYTVSTTGVYYLGRCVVAGTMPQSLGYSANTVATGLSGAPMLAGAVTGQSGTPTVGTTLTLSAVANVDYGYASSS